MSTAGLVLSTDLIPECNTLKHVILVKKYIYICFVDIQLLFTSFFVLELPKTEALLVSDKRLMTTFFLGY